MDDLEGKFNVIAKLIDQCEQSRLMSFAYHDTMFSICFSKVDVVTDYSTNISKRINSPNTTELKIANTDLKENILINNSKLDIQENENIITIVSPFVGTIDLCNKIKLGGNDIHIQKGEVICSIEAMKIYNDIKTTVSGTIIEILVNDFDLVGFEQPIIKIRVDKNDEKI